MHKNHLYVYTYFLVLLSSLPPAGLDCPVPTVTPQPPLCGAETPRVNLCAMLVDSTWNSMGWATYSAHVYTRSVSCLYIVSVKKNQQRRGHKSEKSDFLYVPLWLEGPVNYNRNFYLTSRKQKILPIKLSHKSIVRHPNFRNTKMWESAF